MKQESAERLLNRIMGWNTPEETNNEHPDLQALAISGYDEYKQFRTSMRFIENLARWLNLFPKDKRDAAYRFVRDKLLFITRTQMEQIVSISYPDYVIPILIKQIANESAESISPWHVTQIYNSDAFKILHDQCLFTGLSDGSHMDDFRRSSTMINHEQVSRTHEINSSRAIKIKTKLEERLKLFSKKNPKFYFRNIFLIDDFSASGISYLKEDANAPNGIKGKIGTFYDSIKDPSDPIFNLINCDDLRIYVILYVATENAVEILQKIGRDKFSPIPFTVIPIHILPESIKFDEIKESDFFELVKEEKFGWEKILDEHIEQGGNDKLYLGFGKCALPLILYHNAPNNSLPILHRNDDKTNFKGLFPRLSRHQ